MTRPLERSTDRRQINRGNVRTRNLERRFIPSGASGTPAAAYAFTNVAHTVGVSPRQYNVPWIGFQTTDTSVFGTDVSPTATPHNAAGDSELMLLQFGCYIVVATATFQSGDTNPLALINVQNGWILDTTHPATTEAMASTTPPNNAQGDFAAFSTHIVYVDSTYNPGSVNLLVSCDGVTAVHLQTANIAAFYLGGPNSDLNTVY